MTATLPALQTDGLGSHWTPRLEALLAAGRAAGADLVEVFLERTDHLGLLAEQDRITSVTPAFGMGAGIRVFHGQRDGFVSTNDLSEAGLRRALEQALAAGNADHESLNRVARKTMGKLVGERTRQRPMIVPVIVTV